MKYQTPQSHARPILVVEDNSMKLDFMLQALAEDNLGQPVRICRDGEEVLEFIAAHATPDDPELPMLVLLDLGLPKLDGLEVLRHARQHSIWKQVPIVVVTTSRERTDISRAYDLGANSFIVKSVDFPAFAEMMKRIQIYWLLDNEPPYPKNMRRSS